MDEFIFTQFSCAKYGVLDLIIEYTKKIDIRINGGYIYNITIVNSANGNKAHMVIVQKIILPYEYRSLSNNKIKEEEITIYHYDKCLYDIYGARWF